MMSVLPPKASTGRATDVHVGAAVPLLLFGLLVCGMAEAAVVQVAAGHWHSLALLDDATIRAWGYNFYGQTSVPSGLVNAKQVAGGYWHSLALLNDGTVVAFGSNSDGQASVPSGLRSVNQVAAGGWHSLAALSDGTVRAWGQNQFGQTAIPTGLANVKQVAAGEKHSLALLNDGTVRAWGSDQSQQSSVPTGLARAKQIAAGGSHSLVLLEDGTVRAWGLNSNGQASVPEDLANVKQIAAGYMHSLAVLNNGTVKIWGDNSNGQATAPPGLNNVAQVAAGDTHTLALIENGTVIAFGNNTQGQLWVPTFAPTSEVSSSVPIGVIVGSIVGGVVFLAFAVGGGFLLFRRRNRNKKIESEAALEPGQLEKQGLGANAPSIEEPLSVLEDELMLSPPMQTGSETMVAACNISSSPAVTIVGLKGESTGTTAIATDNSLQKPGSARPSLFRSPTSSAKLLISASDIEIDTTKPPLGEGSFGVVYVGLFRKTVPVAVKKFKAEINACILKAFTKEVTAWEGLVQKNVLPLMAYCIDPPMLVTDLMEQGNLRQYLHSRSWDQSIGLKLLHDVASGMAYLHAHGIVHGDLKAVNVMVDENKALIADFGLAKVRQEIGMTTSSTHGLAGTLVFMAPELLNGDPPQRPADVYAFAMTCYEVLSKGRYPFVDVPNPAVLIYQVGSLKRRPQRPEGVDDKIWALVERCWSHFAEDRPDFGTIRDCLGEILKH